jgi:hypothetical protein
MSKRAELFRQRLAVRIYNMWAEWMRDLFGKGTFMEDGTFSIPRKYVDLWTMQMQYQFEQLDNNKKGKFFHLANEFVELNHLLAKEK